MAKPVAVILLNWNSYEFTRDCVNSLLQYCDEKLFDIIIADNGSTDGSFQFLQQQFPRSIFIDNKENLGFAEGNNRALAYSINAVYRYSLLINTDTLVDEDIVAALSMHMDVHPASGATQPAIFWMHDHSNLWNGRGVFKRKWGIITSVLTHPDAQSRSFMQADWATGCCVMLRNTALKTCGLFNKSFFLYFEDVELSLRLKKNGHQIHYLPSCKMFHAAGGSANLKQKKKEGFLRPEIHYYNNRNLIWVLRSYGSRWFYPIYIIRHGTYFLAMVTYFLVRQRIQKARCLLKGIKDGISIPVSNILANVNIRV